jgi:nucleoside-diphosphate-sugar epimerase
MEILITGGAGFLGARLARQLQKRKTLNGPDGTPQTLRRIRLLDVVPATGFDDPRIEIVTGDIADPGLIARCLTPETQSVFHLAAVVSGQAEADFDLGMRINLDATRHLLDRARVNGNRPRIVFTSSVAVFGGVMPPRVQDSTSVTPQSSYGAQKAICELLITDYSRKGFIDGRAVRMPTVCVRPGAPNKAASSFASGIIREPLNGFDAVCPVAPETPMWLISPRLAIKHLIHGHEIDGAGLAFTRTLNLPGLSISVKDMVAALESVAGRKTVDRILWQPDPAIMRIVNSWPGDFLTTRAEQLGFESEVGFAEIIRAHIDDELGGAITA